MTTNIRAWGNSQGLCIPKATLKQVGLEVNDAVEIIIKGDAIVIKKEKSMDEKRMAWESIKEIRKKVIEQEITVSYDYKKEMEAYLDEKYGKK
jgi:antitoxin component of MazEF toxin-antitoxin module